MENKDLFEYGIDTKQLLKFLDSSGNKFSLEIIKDIQKALGQKAVAYLKNKGASIEDAKDIYMEAVTKILADIAENRETAFDGERNFESFFYKILTNLFYNWKKAKANQYMSKIDSTDAGQDNENEQKDYILEDELNKRFRPENKLSYSESQSIIYSKILNKFSPNHLETFVLFFELGLKGKEIADIQVITYGAVRNQVRNMKNYLKEDDRISDFIERIEKRNNNEQ